MIRRDSHKQREAQELHKLVIKKFKRRKVYARFKNNIWATNSAEAGSLIHIFNHGVKYILCVIMKL